MKNKKRIRNTGDSAPAKKSLGQHWLTSKTAVATMVSTAHIHKNDHVLEIGPGKGILTEALLAGGARVIAIEKDHRMIPLLHERFETAIKENTLGLLEKDVLEAPVPETAYKVVANIPYYLTGAILRHYLSAPYQPTSMTLLVQKEVAERIARAKKESILSLSVKVYGKPKYVQTVKAGSFSPPPKVDSAILHIEGISRNHFSNPEMEERFFTLIKNGFASKRKKLSGNLKGVVAEPAAALAAAGLDPNVRAEDVPLSQWILLLQATSK